MIAFGPFRRAWHSTIRENQINRVVLVVAISAILALSLKIYSTEPIVVVVPTTLAEPLKVGKRGIGEEFSKVWGLHMALLLGNASPDNADFIKQATGKMLDPAIHQPVMAVIEKQIQDIKQDRVSQWFEAKRIVYERSSNRVFVTGYGITKGPTGKEQRAERTYEFEIVAEGYSPVFLYMHAYSGDPKTEREVEREEREAERDRKRKIREERSQ